MFVKKSQLNNLLSDMDVRAKPEARDALDQVIQRLTEELIESSYEQTLASGRKTLYPKDIPSFSDDELREKVEVIPRPDDAHQDGYDYTFITDERMYLSNSLTALQNYIEGLK